MTPARHIAAKIVSALNDADVYLSSYDENLLSVQAATQAVADALAEAAGPPPGRLERLLAHDDAEALRIHAEIRNALGPVKLLLNETTGEGLDDARSGLADALRLLDQLR